MAPVTILSNAPLPALDEVHGLQIGVQLSLARQALGLTGKTAGQ